MPESPPPASRLLQLIGIGSGAALLWSFVGGLAYLAALRGGLPLASDPLSGARERARRGDVAGAVQEYRIAAALDPNDLRAGNEVGELLSKSGRYDEAAAAFRGVFRLSGANVRALAGMGDVRLAQRRQVEAIALYEQSLGAEAAQPAVLNNLGKAHAELLDFDKAIAAFKAALLIAPDTAVERNLARAESDKAQKDRDEGRP